MKRIQYGEPGDAHHITMNPFISYRDGYGYGHGHERQQWIARCKCGWTDINVTAALTMQRAQAHHAAT